MAALKITRQRGGRGYWSVRCVTCEDGNFFELAPWAMAADWISALSIAALHRRLHQERDCNACKRPAVIPKPTYFTGDLIAVGDDVFQFVANNWRSLTKSAALSRKA